ncbi:MAG TPA: hypothetical protein VF479_09850, partial [Pseudolysinimonas sp.]
MSSITRNRALAAFFAVTTGALLFVASPAQAAATSDKDADEACWANADTGQFQCFADEAAFEEAVLEQTGTVLVDPESEYASASRSSDLLASSFVLARFWEDEDYLGAYVSVTSLNSALCSTGGVSGNFSASW